MDILCIGHASYDISFFLDEYPKENTKVETYISTEGGGGPAANAAYLLSKWGLECAFAGLLGNDLYGRRIVEEFKRVHTDVSLMEMREGYSTPLSSICINTNNGNRTIINRKSQKTEMQLRKNLFPGINPKALLFDGHEPETSLKALEVFPQALSVLDAGSLRKGTEILAGKVDYLVTSEKFALSVSGEMNLTDDGNAKRCFKRLQSINQKQVVVTMGERGLLYNNGNHIIHMPAFSSKAVDTTGAGDIFHGAFTYGVFKGIPLTNILDLASMTAAISVASRGVRPSIPALEDVLKALEEINKTSGLHF